MTYSRYTSSVFEMFAIYTLHWLCIYIQVNTWYRNITTTIAIFVGLSHMSSKNAFCPQINRRTYIDCTWIGRTYINRLYLYRSYINRFLTVIYLRLDSVSSSPSSVSSDGELLELLLGDDALPVVCDLTWPWPSYTDLGSAIFTSGLTDFLEKEFL